MENVEWAKGQFQGNVPEELWLCHYQPWPVTEKKPQSLASAAAACLAQSLTLECAGGRMLPLCIPAFHWAKESVVSRENGCVIRAVSWTCQGSSFVYLGTAAAFQPVVFLV